MTRVAQIVGALLEAEAEDFSARDYLLDPDARTSDLLRAIKQGLASYFESVEIYPATEGLAHFPKFFDQGNRYRIRCKRTGPPLRVAKASGWDQKGPAANQKIMIQEFIEKTANKFGYYVDKLEFSGNVFSNLLIILDMWPDEYIFKRDFAPNL